MDTGRRATDWLSGAAAYQASGEDRSGADRRAADRRAPRRRFDPLFAASLVSQIAPAETEFARGYPTPAQPVRRGRMVNLRA